MNKGFVKNIPNMISIIRLGAAIALFFLPPLSLPYFIVYGVCGLSDVLDGFLARKLHAESKLGSILDSICDWVFYLAMAITIFPTLLRLVSIGNWIVIIGVTVIHLLAYLVCAIKFRKLSALHTYANKLQSAIIFLYPFSFIGEIYLLYTLYVYIGGIFTAFSAIEINLIHLLAHRYDERNKSIFLVRKNEATPLPEINKES